MNRNQKDLTRELEALSDEHNVPRPDLTYCDTTSKVGEFLVRSNGRQVKIEQQDVNDFIGASKTDVRLRVAEYLLTDPPVAKLVLRHEFAHYLAFVKYCRTNDPSIVEERPHGQTFKSKARKVDRRILTTPEAIGERKTELVRQRKREKAAFRLYCARKDCSFVTYRQKKSKPVQKPGRYKCPECSEATLKVEQLS